MFKMERFHLKIIWECVPEWDRKREKLMVKIYFVGIKDNWFYDLEFRF